MSTADPPQPTSQAPAPIAPTDDRLTFPPFPRAPEGVTIIPFKEFKERGIQLFATGQEDDVERDGLGIPTVELRVHHDTDECKTETKRKNKRKAAQQLRSATGVRKEWWEMWMEAEDLRGSGQYNPNSSPIDRFYEAAGDFRKGRTWPPGPTGISQMWDQFRLFAGLLSNTPIWTRTDKPSQDDDSDNDDEEELEDEHKVVNAEFERGPKKFPPRRRSRPPYATYDAEPVPVNSDAEVRDLLDKENALKEEKVLTFLNDPEESMKIFLSSYMRRQGLIWHKPNLSNVPRLVGFFIRFLLRNRVFPEAVHERPLRRCLDIIERAQIDLPLTAQVAIALPDDFSDSCKACWGAKAEGYKPLADAPEDLKDYKADEDIDEPKFKKAKLDSDVEKILDPFETAKTAVEKFEEELKAANVEVIKVDEDTLMKNALIEAIKDNADGIEVTTTNNASWGAWGSSDEYNPSSFTPAQEEVDPWADVVANWGPSKVNSLMTFFGPTALPLTHTTGVVEWSVRRVKTLTPPPAPNTVQKSPVSSEEDADAVDIELEKRLAKVVLEPWLDWDKAGDEMPHLSKPRILESSRGPVAGATGEAASDNTAEASAAGVEGVKPHDPFKDDITIFVEPKALEALGVGLGIGATWVQIAREQDFAEGAQKKKKKKSKSKKIPQRYWYAEDVLIVLPSFHT